MRAEDVAIAGGQPTVVRPRNRRRHRPSVHISYQVRKFKMTQMVVKVGPKLRFLRFRVVVWYVLRSTIRRSGDWIEEDPASESLRHFLDSFSRAVIYLPVDKGKYLAAATKLLSDARLPSPSGFNAPIQYLINSQLSYMAQKAALRQWSVEREMSYGMGSNFRSDLKVVATPGEEADHEPFVIWFESDAADEVKLRRKLGERISVISQSDAYVSVIYANSEKKWSRIERAASLLSADMNRKSARCDNSFAVLALEPPVVSMGVPNVELEVDAHLILEGKSVRVAEFHFAGPDAWGRNEFVIDENGTEYPHRDPLPPTQPKTVKLRGLSELLRPGLACGENQGHQQEDCGSPHCP
jgi:hypothetical protein